MRYSRRTSTRTRKQSRQNDNRLNSFIHSLSARSHEIIVCIDTNEPFILGKVVRPNL